MATTSPENKPHVATMYYCIDDDINFYFMAAKNSQKLKDIEVNKNIAITVGFGPALINVQAQGEAEVIYDYNEDFVNKILKKINFHSIDQIPVLRLEKDGIVFLKMKPTRLTFLNLDKEGHPDTYGHENGVIIP